jgi:hypothetical protein
MAHNVGRLWMSSTLVLAVCMESALNLCKSQSIPSLLLSLTSSLLPLTLSLLSSPLHCYHSHGIASVLSLCCLFGPPAIVVVCVIPHLFIIPLHHPTALQAVTCSSIGQCWGIHGHHMLVSLPSPFPPYKQFLTVVVRGAAAVIRVVVVVVAAVGVKVVAI